MVATVRRAVRRIIGLGLMVMVGGLLVASPVSAQDDPFDGLRELIPEGEPGEYDIQEGDALFGQLVEAYGVTTEVPDFGDGSELTGPCGGFAFSYDEDGALLDAAFDAGDGEPPVDLVDGAQAFTSGNPFEVDTRGVVVYFGFAPRSGDGPMNHTWEITTGGISLDSGGDPNSNGNNRNAGIVDLDEDLPVKFTAKVRAEGSMSSDNLADCIGKGHVKFNGNGLTDPVGLAALALFSGGVFGLLFNARPAITWKA